MFSFSHKTRQHAPVTSDPNDTSRNSDIADTAHFVRNARRRGRLPESTAKDEVDRGAVSQMRRAIEAAARRFSDFVQPALASISSSSVDTNWVDVTKQFWLTSVEVLLLRAIPRLNRQRGDIEDVDVSRALIEKSNRILIPMNRAVHHQRTRLKLYLSGMVGLEALFTGAALRAVGMEGGLLSTWPIAIASGATIVLLGAACGGFVWPRLTRPGIPAWARWLIAMTAAIPASVALYIAMAMGVVRSTGSFDIEAIVRIIIAPSPKDIGSIALTVLNCGFFVSAFWLTYRNKRDVDETYETAVAMQAVLEEGREQDVERAQNLLLAIPAAAAAGFALLREERRSELAAAQHGVRQVDSAWQVVSELADREIDAAEAAISRHREAVVGIWRAEWGGDVPAFYFDEPDLRKAVTEVLSKAKEKVDAVHDRLAESEAADAKVDTAITAALAAIQTAIHEAIVKLDTAAYGTPPVHSLAPTASIPPARTSPKLVTATSKGEDDAPQPSK